MQVIGKTRLRNELYCANEDVKHYSLSHSTTASTCYQIQVYVKCRIESAATVRQYFTSFVITEARATRRRTNSGAVTMMLRLLTAAEADDKATHADRMADVCTNILRPRSRAVRPSLAVSHWRPMPVLVSALPLPLQLIKRLLSRVWGHCGSHQRPAGRAGGRAGGRPERYNRPDPAEWGPPRAGTAGWTCGRTCVSVADIAMMPMTLLQLQLLCLLAPVMRTGGRWLAGDAS